MEVTAAQANTREIRAAAEAAPQTLPAGEPEIRSFGGIELPAIRPLHERMREFLSDALDPNASTSIEARVLSAIAQSNVAVVNWHVECRATTCSVLLVYPYGADASSVRDGIENVGPSLGIAPGRTTVFFWTLPNGAPSALVTFGLPRESTPQSVTQESSSV